MATTKKKAPAGKKTGRRTKYDPDTHPQRARELAEKGLTDDGLAEAFGIVRSTFYEWQKRFPDFSDAIRGGKVKPDREVQAALFKRAIGYEYPKQVTTAIRPKYGRKGRLRVVKTVYTTVHVLSDVHCQIFWLKNRMPDRWNDTYRLQHIFNRQDGLEGIRPEDEEAVKLAVERILHGCPVCHEREKREEAEREKHVAADRKKPRAIEEPAEGGTRTPPTPKRSNVGLYVRDPVAVSPAHDPDINESAKTAKTA